MGLMLFVTFLANYVIAPLAQEMAQVEFEHDLQVQDQVMRLASVLQTELEHPNLPYAISSPITLGSSSVPPFSQPSTGQVALSPTKIHLSLGYNLSQVIYAPPRWNIGSNCLNGTPPGSGSCSSNGNLESWNITGNNTVLTIKIVGGNNGLLYNVSGNNDTINIQWSGKDTTAVNVVINGSYDVVNYTKQSADSSAANGSFYFFGQHDTFNFFPPSSTAHIPFNTHVQFVGELGSTCPSGTLSHTDKVGVLAPGKNLINLTVTWWNATGVPSKSTNLYPPGTDPTSTVTWQNRTGSIACAFFIEPSEFLSAAANSEIDVNLLNRYVPAVGFELSQGAVIEQQAGGVPQMILQPSFHFFQTNNNMTKVAELDLVNFVGPATVAAGMVTATVSTRVVSTEAVTLANGTGSLILNVPVWFNLTTYYPAAWDAYFDLFPSYIPGGAVCVPISVITPPATCLAPATGQAVQLSVPIVVSALLLNVATVAVAIA